MCLTASQVSTLLPVAAFDAVSILKASKKFVATAAEKMAKLQHENEKLRTRLKGMKTAKIVGDVKDLIGSHMMHASLEEAYGAAVERLAELSEQNSELVRIMYWLVVCSFPGCGDVTLAIVAPCCCCQRIKAALEPRGW
jgi:hypothetical protein